VTSDSNQGEDKGAKRKSKKKRSKKPNPSSGEGSVTSSSDQGEDTEAERKSKKKPEQTAFRVIQQKWFEAIMTAKENEDIARVERRNRGRRVEGSRGKAPTTGREERI
jgi:hypothetical protein